MRRWLLFITALFALRGSAAYALLPGETLDLTFTAIDGKTIDLKDYRGKIVVLDYFSSADAVSNNEAAKKCTLAEMHSADVVFIGVAADKGVRRHKKLDDFIAEKKIGWPVTNEPAVIAALDVKTPSTETILDPDGHVVWQGLSYDLEPHLQQALKQTPPIVLPQKTIDAILAAAKQVKASAEAGDFASATQTLRDIPASARRVGVTLKAVTAADFAVEKTANLQLAKADAAANSGDYTTAILAYKQLIAGLPEGAAASAARTKLAALSADSKATKAFADLSRQERAASLLAAAQKSIDEKHNAAAVVQLRSLLKQYPTTPAAEKGKAMLASLGAAATQPTTQPKG